MKYAKRFFTGLRWMISAIVAGPLAAAGEAAVPSVWTVEKAIARALESNPDYLAAKFDYDRAQGLGMQASARLLPQLNVSASADRRADGLIDRTPAEFNLPLGDRSFVASTSYDARVEVRQMLFDGLESWGQSMKYKALARQARWTLESVARRTESWVRQYFDAVLWRRRSVEKESQRVAGLKQLAEWADKKLKAGEINEYEKLRAEAELKLAEADVMRAKSDLSKAEEGFRRVLMIPDAGGEKELVLEGELSPRAFELKLSSAIEISRVRRSDLSAAEASVEAARNGVRAARAGYAPRLEAFAAYGSRSSYFDASRRLEGWSLGAVARWNLFDGLETRGRIRAQQAERRMADVRLEELRLQIESQLRELYAGLELARNSVDAQQSASRLAERSLEQVRRLHSLGQASLEQVFQAELTSRRASLGLYEAIFNHNVTISQIEYAVGGLNENSVLGTR